MARDVLENPPPLTPRELRDFPYNARPFPASTFIAYGLLREIGITDPRQVELPNDRVE